MFWSKNKKEDMIFGLKEDSTFSDNTGSFWMVPKEKQCEYLRQLLEFKMVDLSKVPFLN